MLLQSLDVPRRETFIKKSYSVNSRLLKVKRVLEFRQPVPLTLVKISKEKLLKWYTRIFLDSPPQPKTPPPKRRLNYSIYII